MAMVKCRECGGEISSSAWACPQCGKRRTSFTTKIIGGFMLFALLAFVGGLSQNNGRQHQMQSTEKDQAYQQLAKHVRGQLYHPSTARFPDHANHVAQSGDFFTITSWVEAENDLGETVRVFFDGQIRHTGQDRWQLLNLNIE